MVPPKRTKTDLNEGIRFTTFNSVQPINQKNYYTEYLKSDSQYYGHRQFVEASRRAAAAKKAKKEAVVEVKTTVDSDDEEDEDTPEEAAALGSNVIVLHLGSSRTRLGLASDPHPKTIPTVVARLSSKPVPSQKLVDGELGKGMFGEDFETGMKKLEVDFRTRMRNAKRRVLPNATELVASYNKRSEFEEVPDHNDPGRFDWTDVSEKPKYITGDAALRIQPDSGYTLFWPIQHGMLNENAYTSREELYGDLCLVVVSALVNELGISKKSFSDYSVALIVPDMYDKAYVEMLMAMLFKELSFGNVAVLQESVAATFGAGISSACVVDIGAQSTNIACVEEGLCLADSRLTMRYGGDDLTRLFTKQLLRMYFPYRDFDLSRSYDWTLAEELKLKFCSANEAEAAVQLYHIYQRQPGRQARKYNFKIHDDQILCTMAYFHPDIFENDDKFEGRRKLIQKSMDLYEDIVQEPESVIQDRLLYGRSEREPNNIYNISGKPVGGVVAIQLKPTAEGTATETPMDIDSPQVGPHDSKQDVEQAITQLQDEVEKTEAPLIVPLDVAIISAITCACENAPNTEERLNTMVSTILITGAGFNFSHANYYLEERIRSLRPGWSNVTIVPAPRDLQPEMLCWKGMTIFSRIKIASELWISAKEYDLLGCRSLQQKSLGYFWMG